MFRTKRILLLIFCLSNVIQNFVFAQNYVHTYTGNGSIGFSNGHADSATYNKPFGLCKDKYNNLYIADGDNNCIRKINISTDMVTTFAGTGVAGFRDGVSDSAQFNSPSDLCVDDSGNIYVSDFLNQRIRKISATGIVSTIAGTGAAGYANGISTGAKFNYPRGICRDKRGNIYVGDSWNHRIRMIDTLGFVSTYAGGGTSMGVSSVGSLVDGADTSARFYTPSGLSIDQHGTIYVADAYNHRIRMIDTIRMVSTVAGSGSTGPGNGGYLNSNAASSIFNTPTELFIDTNGNELYISDTFNNRIRKLNFNFGMVTGYAGNGNPAYHDSVDSLASFNYPRGIVVIDSIVKMVYVVDYNNHAIRLIAPQNISFVFDDDLRNNISVFPNPSEGSFTLTGIDHIRQIMIYDSKGSSIQEYSIDKRTIMNIDISLFPRGLYMLRLIDNTGKEFTRKIIHE